MPLFVKRPLSVIRIVAPCLFLVLPTAASAQAEGGGQADPDGTRSHTTPLNSVHLLIGQPPVLATPGAGTELWYDFQPKPNRSYCVETAAGENESSGGGGSVITSVYSNAAGTELVGSNDTISDSQGEPDGYNLSRVCFQSPAGTGGGSRFTIKLKNFIITQSNQTYFMRLVETTLFSSWFFQGGDYNSFVLMRNTTRATIDFVINWYNVAGVQVGTSGPQSVVAHGGVGINSKTFVLDSVTNFNGTTEITHNGPPGALVGQMTSLSAAEGLGFDAPLFIRESWTAR